MKLPFFRNRDPEAELFAEALALIEDGLEPDFVLSLYPNEAPWLRPLLEATVEVAEAARTEEPSLYFEASLKRKLFEAQEERTRHVESPLAVVRAFAAGTAITGVAAAVGVALLGWVTAEEAVPGDWNYAFKVASERIEYSLSRGDERLDVQIDATYARLLEVERLAERGEVSAADLERVEREVSNLQDLIETKPLNERHREELAELVERANAVGERLTQEKPQLAPAVERTVRKVNDAVSAGLGKLEPVATPSPASPTPAASAATQSPAAGTMEPGSPAAVSEPPATTTAAPVATPEPAATTPTSEATREAGPTRVADEANVEEPSPDLPLEPTP